MSDDKVQINARIPAELKEACQARAWRRRQTLQAFIEEALAFSAKRAQLPTTARKGTTQGKTK